MAYLILALRSPDEPADNLYPNPGAATNSIALEDSDGDIQSFPVEGIRTSLRPPGEEEIKLDEFGDLKATLWVTDGRVAFACSHPLNGGGFGGEGAIGVTAAIVANVVSRSIARGRTKGQSLVAQVRHEWLVGVIARDRRGWGSANKLQIFIRDPEQENMFLIFMVQLPKSTLASTVAEVIVEKAARFQAGKTDNDAKRASLLAYAQSPTSNVAAQTQARSFILPTK